MSFFCFIGVVTLCISSISCTKKAPVPEVTAPLVSVTSAPSSQILSLPESPSPSPIVNSHVQEIPLALIDSFKPDVSFRRSKELLWQTATPQLFLYRYDALQTQAQASAKILFYNGSELELEEKTLIIINPTSTKMRTALDRAVVRGGNLRGTTKRELWLLTSAAVIRMKAQSSSKPAQATLSLTEGKTLKVELEQGVGTITPLPVLSSPSQSPLPLHSLPTKILIPRQPIVLRAPALSETFGTQEMPEILNQWEEKIKMPQPPPPQPAPSPVAKPTAVKTSPPPQRESLVILSPPNYSEMQDSKMTLKGRVRDHSFQVLINGEYVSVQPNFEFHTPVSLNLGANTILIQLLRPNLPPLFYRWVIVRKPK